MAVREEQGLANFNESRSDLLPGAGEKTITSEALLPGPLDRIVHRAVSSVVVVVVVVSVVVVVGPVAGRVVGWLVW